MTLVEDPRDAVFATVCPSARPGDPLHLAAGLAVRRRHEVLGHD